MFLFTALIASSAFGSVAVSSPTNGATVGTSVHYVASASSSCAKGVSSIGIYTADGVLAHVGNGAKLDTTLNLSPGTYKTTVQQWDNCGGTDRIQVTINVTAEGGVNVSSPANNSNVASPVRFVANAASSSCATGVAAVGVYTADNVLAYTQNGAALNTTLNLNPGTYNTTVQSWDGCGASSKTPVTITVAASSTAGVKVSAPANNSTVTSPVHFVASATSSCAKGDIGDGDLSCGRPACVSRKRRKP